jgi:hypothetical protein
VKTRIAAIGLVVFGGMLCAADLNDSFNSLKEAVEKKDAAKVKTLASETSQEARKIAAEAQPSDAGAVADWKARVDFAKGADKYSEYALATVAAQSSDPAMTIALTEQLLAQNPKSQYMDQCASAYLTALGKQSPDKALAGATKISAVQPDNEDALLMIVTGNAAKAPDRAAAAANRLVTVVRAKAKPEGVGEADWDKRKNYLLGQGYFYAGAGQCSKSSWVDCDRDLKAALPLIGGQQQGSAYFYLGLANYQLGKLTQDRSKIQQGIKYSDQAAGMPGPMQTQAARNSQAMKAELSGPAKR